MARFRVVSWNMAFNKPGPYKSRALRQRQWAMLAALDPDVAVLQECRVKDFHELVDASFRGMHTLHTPAWDRSYGVAAVLARAELQLNPADTSHLDTRTRSWIKSLGPFMAIAQISLADAPVLVASVHAWAAEVNPEVVALADQQMLARPPLKRMWINDLAVQSLKPLVSDGRFIIGADLNIARLFDDNYRRWRYSSHEFFARTKDWGWEEALRRFHENELRTYLAARSAPYELDHLSIDAKLAKHLDSCDVLNSRPFSELSDHGPVVAEFSIDEPTPGVGTHEHVGEGAPPQREPAPSEVEPS